jgi:aerotaxis receptor
MRKNLPVYQNSYSFPADRTLVSVTDLKGRITYCNNAFVEVSGFQKSELIGQPHNIVRHPDMPEEAFRDMWSTISSRQPWSGMVKNRRKNGDYYWVKANATPMMDGDQITGFLSVRTLPTSAEINSAEELYSKMRSEHAENKLVNRLHRGEHYKGSFAGKLSRLLALGVVGQITLVQLLAFIVVIFDAYLDLPTWTVLAVVSISGLGTLLRLKKAVISPMNSLIIEANRLAGGDLSTKITVGAPDLVGQLQRAMNQMSVNLKTVVTDVRSELDGLTDSVSEISVGNHDLSSRTESQASSLEETAASMEEITGTVQQNAVNADHGTVLATDTSDIARRSNLAVSQVAKSMDEILTSSKRIEDIIQVIEGVAFQTNILALNAAVEAARAGDAGRGFAVVASEVRSLAHRTSEAAKEIRTLISSSAITVASGNAHTKNALERMGEAVASVLKVQSVLTEISTSASEQKIGIGQINEAVSHMDSMTQQNAAMVEQLAAATSSLSDQLVEVSNSMRLFRLNAGDVTLSQADAVSQRREAKLLGKPFPVEIDISVSH